MKINRLFAIIILLAFTNCKEKKEVFHNEFNLDFEQIQNGNILPDGWVQWGDYITQIDSTIVQSGNYSVKITAIENVSYTGRIVLNIPNTFKGSEIKLEGFIKTENIENGHAGLQLMLSRESEVLTYDNMMIQNLQGTNDWKKYSILLPFYEDADLISIAAILTGTGQAWFDNFTLTIDGNYIQQIEPLSVATKIDSKFQLKEITQQYIENLYELCQSWGYLKYHHPAIAKGDYNWDYELFRILPEITAKDFDKKLQKWEKSYGKISEVPNKEHYYLDFVSGVGNPIFKNESIYPQMDWSDDGFRLLALFRYWNMIEYFFPNKHLIDKDWDDVLKEYIPKMIGANDELSYKLTLLELIGEIQDTHANIWQQDNTLDNFFGTKVIPLDIGFIENTFVVTKLYGQHPVDKDIKTGTEIVTINKKPVAEIIENVKFYFPASNPSAQYRDIGKKLLRTNENSLDITLKYQNVVFTKKIPTIEVYQFNYWEDNTPSHKELQNGEIGYIYPGSLKQGEIHEIMEKFKNKKGIVVDLRCYPSDFIVFSMGKYIMPKPTEFVKFSMTSLENPGQFTFTEPLMVGEDNPEYYKGKIAILINETTQSQSEYTTMALRVAPKAQVFGSQTAGADGNVSEIYLPGNIRTMISGIGIYYPDGTETQRIGIVPDIEVKPTIKGIRDNRDEVLEKAIEYILE